MTGSYKGWYIGGRFGDVENGKPQEIICSFYIARKIRASKSDMPFHYLSDMTLKMGEATRVNLQGVWVNRMSLLWDGNKFFW